MRFKEFLVLFFFIACMSCKQEVRVYESQYIEKGLKAFKAPFSTEETTVFYPNIVYGESERNVYDFFKPNLKKTSSLLILIHGGGFVTGDKSKYYDSYRYRGFINRLLEKNIAVVAMNYRFVNPHDGKGIKNSLQDVKSVLQHVRYFSDTLHVNKEDVMLYGSSAGAAAAMWIAFQDDMAQQHDEFPVRNESTRVKGIVGISPQANYDLLNWYETVFSDFINEGLSKEALETIVEAHRILLYYGVDRREEIATETVQTYIQQTNMLEMLTNDDPEFYLVNEQFSGEKPTTLSDVFHHPFHVKAIQEKSTKVGAKGIFYAPTIDLDTSNGENYEEFIIRLIGN